jgi:methionyl-tRNA formyltransferase
VNDNTLEPLRLVFMGTAELACPSLAALIAAPFGRVLAVVTQPDKPKGRDLRLQPSPVKELALRHTLPLLQPDRARNEDFVQQIRELAPDLVVVAAYGQILPQTILDVPRFGCLNVHTSLLPKYRGASPIQTALLNGDAQTGVTIMKMDAGMDTGPIIAMEATPIRPEDNASTLHDRLAELGAKLLVRTIPDYVSGGLRPCPQPTEGASLARKISKDDGRVEWSLPSTTLHNRLRAFTPWPGLFTFLSEEGKRTLIKIWEAEPLAEPCGAPGTVLRADKQGIVVACGSGALRITVLQREGGRRLSAGALLAGHPLKSEFILG